MHSIFDLDNNPIRGLLDYCSYCTDKGLDYCSYCTDKKSEAHGWSVEDWILNLLAFKVMSSVCTLETGV